MMNMNMSLPWTEEKKYMKYKSNGDKTKKP